VQENDETFEEEEEDGMGTFDTSQNFKTEIEDEDD